MWHCTCPWTKRWQLVGFMSIATQYIVFCRKISGYSNDKSTTLPSIHIHCSKYNNSMFDRLYFVMISYRNPTSYNQGHRYQEIKSDIKVFPKNHKRPWHRTRVMGVEYIFFSIVALIYSSFFFKYLGQYKKDTRQFISYHMLQFASDVISHYMKAGYQLVANSILLLWPTPSLP